MPTELQHVLDAGSLRTVFQPIVDLATGGVVAYEALTRGPEGSPLERPDLLFAAARAEHLLGELDAACLRAAFGSARRLGIGTTAALFVNVEPRTLDVARRQFDDEAPDGLVVVELTERDLVARPSDLLHTVALARQRGWAVALDDVGADPRSLAMLPMVQPDIVKLDLRLVQERPDRHTAAIATAVQAEAERSGLRVLAEGVETEEQLQFARSLGATLSQGWLHGRPAPDPAPPSRPVIDLTGLLRGDARPAPTATPAELLHPHHELRLATKPLLIQISKHLERQAREAGETAIVLGTFQHARYFHAESARRYTDLGEACALVGAFGVDMPFAPAAGVRGGPLEPGDPLAGEWDVVVIGAHFAGALVAVDLGDEVAESERRFSYLVTYDRDIVQDLARSLLVRIWPDLRDAGAGGAADPGVPQTAVHATSPALPAAVAHGIGIENHGLLERALAATGAGVTIADARLPDLPLIYVNDAFETLSGYPREEAIGRNCRFLQGAGADPQAIAAMREGLAQQRPVNVRILNERRDGTPWWNEIHLSPVLAADGTLTHVVGIQHDVTAEVEATARLDHLARHDELTGLRNRRSLAADLAREFVDRPSGTLLYLDLVGFKQVNDRFGHAVGDDLLRRIGSGLWAVLDDTATAYRIGGDEFAILLLGPSAGTDEVAARVAAEVVAAIARPLRLDGGEEISVGASVGWANLAEVADADDALRRADLHLYANRGARVPVTP